MRSIKTSFAGGEFAPNLDGRVDIQKYQTAAQKLSNFIVTRYGAAQSRPGTTYVDTTRTTGDIKFIEFSFSIDQQHLLEFTDYAMRVITDGGVTLISYRSASYKWTLSGSGTSEYYLELAAGGDPTVSDQLANFTVYENSTAMTKGAVGSLSASEWSVGDNDTLGYNTLYVRLADSTDPDTKAQDYVQADYVLTTPWAESDLAELDYVQDADTVFFAHPDYSPRKVQRLAEDSWTISEMTFTPSISAPSDFYATKTGDAGTDRNVFYQISAISSELEESLPTAEKLVQMSLNWQTAGRVDLFWNAIADGLESSPVFQWTASGSGTNEYYCELNGGGDPSLSEPTTVYEDKQAMTAGTAGSLSAGEWDYADNDSLGYSTIYVRLADNTDPDTKATGWLTYKLSTDDQWSVYKNYSGDWGWLATVQTPWFLDYNQEPLVTIAPKTFENPFAASGDYPGAVGIFEQRLFYGRTDNNPQKVWSSYTGHLNNFGKSKPLTASDPIEVRLKSGGRMDEIRHFVSLARFLMITAGSEWVFDHGDNSDALTPYNPRFRPIEYRGSIKDVKPIRINDSCLFVNRDGKDVIAIMPSDVQYRETELSLLVPHLFKGRTIVDWAYQQHPNNVVWMIMSDGAALTMTYLPDQEIFAFSRHETDGLYKAVGSLPTDGEDEVYFCVERIINGTTKRFIEQLHTRVFDYIADAYCVDAGLTYDEPYTITDVAITATEITVTSAGHPFVNGDYVFIRDVEGISVSSTPATDYSRFNAKWYKVLNKTANTFELGDYSGTNLTSTHFTGTYERGGTARESVLTVSGLDHLEGEEVAVLADGSVYTKTVSSGAITLATAHPGVATVHAGLGYNCDIETLRLEEDTRSGTIQGEKKRLKNIVLRMDDSVGGSCGVDEDSLTTIKWRQNEDYRDPLATLTGDRTHTLSGNWNTEGRVYFRQSDPLPTTILAMIMRYDIGGKS